MVLAVAALKRLHDTLNRLAAAEAESFAREFLAPRLRGGRVQIRISGVVCRLKVEPESFEGWGVFRPTSSTTAQLVRPARLAERKQYLELLPLLRLIVCRRDGDQWLAIPAHRADTRFRIEGLMLVRLIEEAQLFEVLHTRFDGAQCWYEGPDPRRDPATAAYLRRRSGGMVEPEQLSRPGLTAEERVAYALYYLPRLQAAEAARRDRIEERLRTALAHADATLGDYTERDGVYRVAYELDGRRHVSVVAKHDLSVQTAGICLSGQDRRFDLQSLVGVLREAQRQRRGRPGRARSGHDAGGGLLRRASPRTLSHRAAEQYGTLVGARRGRIWHTRRIHHRSGAATSVRFDGMRVLRREEGRRDVLGFYHTHPDGAPHPSARDVRTMRAWCSAFGKPLLCVIASPEGLAGFRFDEDEVSDGVPLASVEVFPRGMMLGIEADGG